jgi:ribosome biogenesis protein ERB1
VTKNRVGNIPMEYYNDYSHIGYNIKGEKFERKGGTDELQRIIDREDNPNYWRTVRDVVNDRDVVLNDSEYNLVKALLLKKYPSELVPNPYEEFLDRDYEDSIHPLTNIPSRKASFIPSKWEARRVRKLINAIKKGWIKLPSATDEAKRPAAPTYYLMWDPNKAEDEKKHRLIIPPPSLKLPGASPYIPLYINTNTSIHILTPLSTY